MQNLEHRALNKKNNSIIMQKPTTYNKIYYLLNNIYVRDYTNPSVCKIKITAMLG